MSEMRSSWRRARRAAVESPHTREEQEASGNPYVGPRPFDKQDRAYFFGRSKETQTLVSLVVAKQAIVLYAPSGAGKTSLLQASLLPRLETEEQMKIITMGRVGGELPLNISGDEVDNIYVFNALLNMFGPEVRPQRLVDLSLSQGLQSLSGMASDRPSLLVLDQFEELFTFAGHRYLERSVFFDQLLACLHDFPSLSLLLALREDYIAQLDAYAYRMPDRLRARFRMERLGYSAALAAIKEPARLAGLPFATGVAEDLVAHLTGIRADYRNSVGKELQEKRANLGIDDPHAGWFVEPMHLQIVCRQLWDRMPVGRECIEAEDVKAFGDVDQALINYYESALQSIVDRPDLSITERQLRAWFAPPLITPAGTRGLVYRNEKEQETEGLPNEVVDVLYDSYLIRPYKRGTDTFYELAHDRLIEPIIASNQTWQRKHRTPLSLAAEAWLLSDKDPTNLYQGKQIREAQSRIDADPELFTDLDREFVSASEKAYRNQSARRLRLTVLTVFVGLFILAGLTVYAFVQRDAALDALATTEAALANADMSGAAESSALSEANETTKRIATLESNLSAVLTAQYVTPEPTTRLDATLIVPSSRTPMPDPTETIAVAIVTVQTDLVQIQATQTVQASLSPELTFIGTEEYEASGQQWVRYRLSVANWSSYPAEFFEAAPELPPCGLNTNASRTWVNIYNEINDQRIYGFCALNSPDDLTKLWFAEEKGSDPPTGVYIIMNDRLTGEQYVSNTVAP